MARPSQLVQQHAANPQNAGPMDAPDAVGHADVGGRAPRAAIYLKVERDVVTAASFTTFGCGYLVASCSRLTELVTGAGSRSALSISAGQLVEELGGFPPHKRFCADIAVEALRNAIRALDGAATRREPSDSSLSDGSRND